MHSIIFFVQAFKIVIHSWKFSMLLLYILWDDWPIFRISGSNQQLQQQLEYTLLKPGCHSWWISKMQSGYEDTLEERYAIKLCFKLGKNATETYGMFQIAFGLSCMNRALVFEWEWLFFFFCINYRWDWFILLRKKATSTIYKTHCHKRSNTTTEDNQRNGRKRLANIGFFLYQLDPEERRLVRRLELLHLKNLKKKQSVVFNQTYIYIYIYRERENSQN